MKNHSKAAKTAFFVPIYAMRSMAWGYSMEKLNDIQQKAVWHFKGPGMAIGTPGSGKTRVITERVRYLVEEKGISGNNILVITFTRAAAMEMKMRYGRSCNAAKGRVTFGTFHAIFFAILRQAYNYGAENIIREELKRQILRELVQQSQLEIQDENEFISDVEGEISRVKGEGIDISHYYSNCCPDDVFRKIFRNYNKALERNRLIDFDDMLVYCYELFLERKDILALWQRQYPFIMIDEYQDINRIQYEVVKLLAKPLNNLFVVGDDDQSIYGFRGAKPDTMKQFIKDYPETKRYPLEYNYRCSGAIVDMAGRLIECNKNRLSKKLQSVKGKGEPVQIYGFANVTQENDAIRKKIIAYHEKGVPYSSIAVLFRTNTQARALTSKLMEFNIPFVVKEKLPNLYEHWMVKDILTYIKVARGSRERSDLLRIINKPKRYVHRNALSEAYIDLDELESLYEDKDWMVERIEQFREDLKMLATLKPFSAVNFIRRGIGYDEYIQEYADYRGMPANDLYGLLDELQEETKGKRSYDEWFEAIAAYGEELNKQMKKNRDMQSVDGAEDAVAILTMHGAKGLEYECVFLPDVNEGVIPHSKAILDEDVEEERRMFYVAMTRAEEHLHIYHVRERFNKEVDVSRFLEEMCGMEECNVHNNI